MNIFKKLSLASKLIKTYQEVKQFLDTTHLTDDIKNDITVIKEALNRLAAKIPAIKTLIDIIF